MSKIIHGPIKARYIVQIGVIEGTDQQVLTGETVREELVWRPLSGHATFDAARDELVTHMRRHPIDTFRIIDTME